MRIKWTGKEPRDIWGFTFAPGVAVEVVDPALLAKCLALGFEEVKRGRKLNDQDAA